MDCERKCGKQAVSGNRYCADCGKIVISELAATGYLEQGHRGHVGDNRTSDQKEKTHETKHGCWGRE
jgi:hypothetical protein